MFYVIYGKTNGEFDDEAAACTNDIIQHCLDDACMQDEGPKIIIGDLNAPIHRLLSLSNAINMDDWVDVGHAAGDFGQPCDAYTCQMNESAQKTRRDYVIANRDAFDCIEHFQVDYSTKVPVHAILSLVFKNKAPKYNYNAVRLPQSLEEIFHQKCVDVYGDANIKREMEKKLTKLEKSNTFTYEPQVNQYQSQKNRQTNKQKAKNQYDREVSNICDNINESCEQNEEETISSQMAHTITAEQREAQLKNLHNCMDARLQHKTKELNSALRAGDGDEFMQLFSEVVEQAAKEYGQPLEENRYKGRGNINIKKICKKPHATYNRDTMSLQTPATGELNRQLKQYRRLLNIRGCCNVVAKLRIKNADCDADKKNILNFSEMAFKIRQDLAAYRSNAKKGDNNSELLDHFDEREEAVDFNFFTLTRFIEQTFANFIKLRDTVKKGQKRSDKNKYSGPNAHGNVSRAL